MSSLLIALLNMSITASYTAIIIILLRSIFKLAKLPSILSYLIWAIVFIRLIVPFAIESKLSFIFFKPEIITYQVMDSSRNIMGSSANVGNTGGGGSVGTPPVIQEVIYTGAENFGWQDNILVWLSYVWLGGVVLLVSHALYAHWRLARNLQTATKVKENIYETDRITSPFVMGIIRPRIYMPLGLANEHFDYIVKHEQAHIRKLDYLVKPLIYLIAAIHWFNPLVWLSYKWMMRDMEMACDESVLKHSQGDSRASYSNTLLSLATRSNGFPGPLSFGESDVLTRVKNTMNYKRPVFWISFMMLIIIGILATGLLSNPLQAQETADKQNWLWSHRTEYIGNNSKVSMLSSSLEYPVPFQYDHIELQTGKEPYGLTVYMKIDEEFDQAEGLDLSELLRHAKSTFDHNAFLLFGLIENAGEIVFQMNADAGEDSLFYTRDWAQTKFNGNLFATTKSAEDFQKYYEEAGYIAAREQIITVVEGFGDRLKQVRKDTVPKERTIELIDQYYKPLVEGQLLAEWKDNFDLLPARVLSSPWDDRIEVDQVKLTSSTNSEVKGKIIGVAGGEVVGEDEVTIILRFIDGAWKIASFQKG